MTPAVLHCLICRQPPGAEHWPGCDLVGAVLPADCGIPGNPRTQLDRIEGMLIFLVEAMNVLLGEDSEHDPDDEDAPTFDLDGVPNGKQRDQTRPL